MTTTRLTRTLLLIFLSALAVIGGLILVFSDVDASTSVVLGARIAAALLIGGGIFLFSKALTEGKNR